MLYIIFFNTFCFGIENSEDDIGRTVAIIVGVLAGVALFVVFISFFKRACKCHFYFMMLLPKKGKIKIKS
jgi:hypothetical protein